MSVLLDRSIVLLNILLSYMKSCLDLFDCRYRQVLQHSDLACHHNHYIHSLHLCHIFYRCYTDDWYMFLQYSDMHSHLDTSIALLDIGDNLESQSFEPHKYFYQILPMCTYMVQHHFFM